MHRLLIHTRLFVAALLIAALTFVPVLDAVACAFESTTTSESAPAGDDTGRGADAGAPDPAGTPDHPPGVCEHNHCHHCSANVLPDLHAAAGSQLPRQLPIGPSSALALDERADNLMRPPRS